MSYHVLARKWRPQKFSDVVGQEHVMTVLTNSLSLGRIHHAYFFSGTRGVGKTTIARILAKGMNCETNITASPCGKCNNCREIEQGRFIDLIEIDAASSTKVEDTRELLDNIQYAPASGRFKIYLIDEVHMLSRHSFNALLKTLEEPPAHVKFLLATTEPQKLPLTILSRCLQFHLTALNIEQICSQLTKVLQLEQITAEPCALPLLASAANGSMRDALSLTDQAIALGQGEISTEGVRLMLGKLTTEQPLALIEALINADGSGLLAQIAQCAARGVNWEGLLIEMLALLHRLAMWQILPEPFNHDEDHRILSRLITLANRLPAENLQLYYQTILIGRKELPFAPDPRMGVEMTLLRALAFHPVTVEKYASNHDREQTSSADTCQVGTATIVKSAGTINGLLEAAAITTTNLAASADEHVGTEHRETASVHTAYTCYRASIASSKNYIMQNTNVCNIAKIAVLRNHSIAGVHQVARSQQSVVARKLATERMPNASFNANTHVAWQNNTCMPEAEPHKTSLAVERQLLDLTKQILHTRTALLRSKEQQQKIIHQREQASISTRASLDVVDDRRQRGRTVTETELEYQQVQRTKTDRWLAKQPTSFDADQVTPTQTLRTTIEHDKKKAIALYLKEESMEHDSWAAQVHRLVLPELVQQLALNAWKEDLAPGNICLHLRTSHSHLNSVTAQRFLIDALSADIGLPIALTVTEDDDLAQKTPMECRHKIYDDKRIRARQEIMADDNLKILRRFFDAELDEASIRPI